jgi:Subtilase family
MAKRSTGSASTRTHRSRGGALNEAHPREQLAGQLIVRFKQSAVEHVAARAVPMSASARIAAAALPDEVGGPLKLLREQAGMVSAKPLFAPRSRPIRPQSGVMTLAAVHNSLATSATATPRETLRGFQLVKVRGKVDAALLRRVNASRAVEFAEAVPNRWMCSADPLINQQWGLRAIRWFDAKRPNAKKIHVAVLDTGIDSGHPDLRHAIESYRHDGNSPRDFFGHGTHVGGIIAATMSNAVGIAGVANCRLHCWKIFDDPPKGSRRQTLNFEIYSAALADALDSEVRVINMSIGGTDHSRTEAIAFQHLADAGVVVVAAMGNEYEEGNPKEYPAGYPGVLGVGAVDEDDHRAEFSCTGKHIGLVAPGVDILSTVPRVKAIFADATKYDSWPGTSMATPYVAGAAALMYAKQAKSKAAAAAVVKRLKSSAKKLPRMKKRKFSPAYGAGLLNLVAALKRR